MKRTLITILRDRNASIEQYRHAADLLGTVLAVECDALFPKAAMFVDTPLARLATAILIRIWNKSESKHELF